MLGQRLKKARLEAGLSQRQLCGEEITRNMLSQIESEKAKPSMQTLSYLAQKLGKPLSWFLEEETVTSPNQRFMEQARQDYMQRQYQQCLEQLEKFREPDPMFNAERWLLGALAMLALAQEAVADGKPIYARSLLEAAEQAGKKTAYYTPALERERLLLLYQAQPAEAAKIAAGLPADDRELLLRAQAYLDGQEYGQCCDALSAAQIRDARWHYLYGQALMGLKQYTQAVEHFIGAEEDYPQDCARALETCYRELEDYKMAYLYACKQRKA
jgi:transcriptional regulator with XRE-family HTH domain